MTCPMCGGSEFDERFFFNFFHGAVLRRKRPLGRPVKEMARWFVCRGSGYVVAFASTSE